MAGEFAAKNLEDIRNKWIKKSPKYRRRSKDIKTDPFRGSPMAKGIVLSKRAVEARQPNSGKRKCVRVRLVKTGKEVTGAPKENAIKFIDDHDEVIISGINGSKGGPKGDLWGVRYKVEKVNRISLEMLRTGKKEKVKR